MVGDIVDGEDAGFVDGTESVLTPTRGEEMLCHEYRPIKGVKRLVALAMARLLRGLCGIFGATFGRCSLRGHVGRCAVVLEE
jgi:hypothetical protein